MDLRLHNPDGSAKRFCSGDRLINRKRSFAARHRHTEPCKQGLCLMFMDVHALLPVTPDPL
jgi:hypothetical protein